ncbi:chlorhexidine efflux transporter [Aurantimonas sp. C2-6-R+9]
MIVTPLGAWAFHLPTSQIGVVALIGATIATLWNYAYNLGFDHMMWRFYGRTSKSPFRNSLRRVQRPLGWSLRNDMIPDFRGFGRPG